MPINLEAISPARRAAFISVGKQYGSSDTLAQADKTLNAYDKYAGAVAAHGFVADDAADLRELKALLEAAGVSRETVRADKKSTNAALANVLRKGKGSRRRLRSVLEQVAARVARSGGDEVAARAIEGVLAQTRTSGVSPGELATQLGVLLGVLTSSPVASLAAERGGMAAAEEATAIAGELRSLAADVTTTRGTPAETERLDLLDGLIVDLVRAARAAARSAATAAGEESIAKDFELSELYRSSGGGAKKDEKKPE